MGVGAGPGLVGSRVSVLWLSSLAGLGTGTVSGSSLTTVVSDDALGEISPPIAAFGSNGVRWDWRPSSIRPGKDMTCVSVATLLGGEPGRFRTVSPGLDAG
jgi:hypothetical protein